MVCTRMFCPCRVGEIHEVCFMHIKRAECGESETTWVCTLCKNSSVMKITKDGNEYSNIRIFVFLTNIRMRFRIRIFIFFHVHIFYSSFSRVFA